MQTVLCNGHKTVVLTKKEKQTVLTLFPIFTGIFIVRRGTVVVKQAVCEMVVDVAEWRQK